MAEEKQAGALGAIPEQAQLDAADIPFATDGLSCPTIYADLVRGTAVMGEISKIALIEHRTDAIDNTIKAVHVAMLTVPTSQLRAWGDYFTNLANLIGIPQSEAPKNV